MQYYASRGNAYTVANFDIAKYLGPCPQHYAGSDLWMTVAPLVAGPSQCHALQQRTVVADDCRLADTIPLA